MSPWGIPEKPHQQRAHSAGIEKVETGMKVSVVLGSANRFNLQSNTNKGKGEGGGLHLIGVNYGLELQYQ